MRKSATLVDIELLEFIKKICEATAEHFGLKHKRILLMDSDDSLYYCAWGYCDGDDVVIKIRRGDRYIAIEDIIDTIAHELGHLLDNEDDKEDHSKEWKKRYTTYKRWIKKTRISITKGENDVKKNKLG